MASGSAKDELARLRDKQAAGREQERQLSAKYADGRPMVPADKKLMTSLRKVA